MDEHPRDRMARIFNCEPLGTKMAQDLLDDYLRLKVDEVCKLYGPVEGYVTWREVLRFLHPDSTLPS